MSTDRAHALYRFYADAGALLYVGITLDPGSRWRAHRDDKPWWQQVTKITIEVYRDRASVLEAERRAIVDERPKYNIVHNTSRPQADVTDDLDELLLALTGWTPGSGRWGTRAEHMPDQCQHCRPGGIYLPYRWVAGRASYQCKNGHRWACWWGHELTGDAPDNRGQEAL